MKPEDIKAVLDRVDEFNAIVPGDTIANANESRKIYHVSNSFIVPKRQISFVCDDVLASVTTLTAKSVLRLAVRVVTKAILPDGENIDRYHAFIHAYGNAIARLDVNDLSSREMLIAQIIAAEDDEYIEGNA